MRKLFIAILVVLLIYIIFRPTIKEHMEVAVMPNEFIQNNDDPTGGNNLDNYLAANFEPDNQDLSRFFSFSPTIAKFYPQSDKIVNNYYAVPRVI